MDFLPQYPLPLVAQSQHQSWVPHGSGPRAPLCSKRLLTLPDVLTTFSAHRREPTSISP
jgi:hypothetical protein